MHLDNGELESVQAAADSLQSEAVSPAQQLKLTHLKARVLYRQGRTAELIGLAEKMEQEQEQKQKQPGDVDTNSPHLEALRHMAEQAREQRARRNLPAIKAQTIPAPVADSTASQTQHQNQKREN